MSSSLKSPGHFASANCSLLKLLSATLSGPSPLEEGSIEGDTPVSAWIMFAYDTLSLSRVAWECSSK